MVVVCASFTQVNLTHAETLEQQQAPIASVVSRLEEEIAGPVDPSGFVVESGTHVYCRAMRKSFATV